LRVQKMSRLVGRLMGLKDGQCLISEQYRVPLKELLKVRRGFESIEFSGKCPGQLSISKASPNNAAVGLVPSLTARI